MHFDRSLGFGERRRKRASCPIATSYHSSQPGCDPSLRHSAWSPNLSRRPTTTTHLPTMIHRNLTADDVRLADELYVLKPFSCSAVRTGFSMARSFSRGRKETGSPA